jgi:hypothetical protein
MVAGEGVARIIVLVSVGCACQTIPVTASAADVLEGASATFTVDLAARVATDAYSVKIDLAGTGGATTPADYAALALSASSGAGWSFNAATGVLTAAAGATGSAVFTSAIATDALVETGEGITVTLSAPVGTGLVLDTAKTIASSTISDPAAAYTLTAGATSVNEGASATFNLVTELSEAGKTVAYTLSGITAADVTGGLTGSVVVGADGKAVITIAIVADALTENTQETLTVTLNGKPATASILINDTSVGPDASVYMTKGQELYDGSTVAKTANKYFASETYFNVDGVGPTINTGDFITGTAGRTDNSLTITDLTAGVQNGNIPAGVTMLNIQNVILNSSNNTAKGTGFSTVGFADVRQLDGTTNGDNADVFVAKNGTNGTAITVSHLGFVGDLTVVGGTSVTATSLGANIMVGNSAAATVPLATQVATGAITVNQQNTGTGKVNVYGGTTVNVNTTSTSNTGVIEIGNTAANTGNSSAGAIANASSKITVLTSGTGAVSAFGGTDVSITDTALKGAGAITVGDVGRVDASNQPTGNVTIVETATIAYNGLAGSSNNKDTSGAIGVYGGKNVTITTNAANYVNIGNLGTAKENSLNPTGTITVTNTGIVNDVADAGVGGSKGAMRITGGTDVTVTTTGADVTIGRTANAVVDQVSNPTGNVSVTETMNGNGFARTVKVDGGVAVTVAAKGQNVEIGKGVASAPTGAVLVTQSDMLTGTGAYLASTNAGDVTVDGGTTVTVNTTGGNVTVGGVVGGVNTVPSGAVAITRTFSGPGADATSVQGGTTVNITTTKTSGAITVGAASAALNAAGTALKDAALAPTGNVTIVDATTVGAATAYGTGAVNVNTNGATTVSIKGGDVATVIDVQSTLATGGSNAGKAVGTSTLATVVIDGQQVDTATVAIKSDALANLSVLNQQGAADVMTITNNTAAHALTITQGGNKVNNVTVNDAKAGSLTVTDNGVASTKDLILQAVKATTLTVNGTAANTIDLTGDVELTTLTLKNAGAVTLKAVETLTKVATIDASTSTGTVTTSINPTTVNAVSQKFTGGSGVTTLTVGVNAFSYGDGVLLTGGSGSNDILVANYAAQGTDVAMGSGTASIKGFEYLGLGALANSVAGNYDAAGFSGVTLGAVAAGGSIAITNAAKNASLSITAAPGVNTSFTGVAAATTGTSDGLTINVNTVPLATSLTLPDGINAGTVTANGYETISIVSNGATKTTVNSMTLTDTGSAGTGTLAISGAGKMTLTDSTTRFSKIDVTNSNTVVVDAVAVSNTGAAITGGAGSLSATGATGGTQVAKIVLDGTTTKTFAVGSVWTVSLSNTSTAVTFTYTAAATDTMATATAYMAAAINAGATTGPVVLVGVNPAVTASSSGGSLVLSKAAPFQVYGVLSGAASTVTTSTAALVGAQEEQLITITGTTTAGTAATATVTINGTAATYTSVAAGESTSTIATGLAAAINALTAAQKIGLNSAVASGSKVILTGGATGEFMSTAAGAVTTNGATTTASAVANNYATANDSFTSGSGGGTYSAGLGGSWGTTLHRYSSGSEAVNLAASAAKVDVIALVDGRVVTNNGTMGGVVGFTVGSLNASDTLTFGTVAVPVNKTALANVTVVSSVAAVTGAATMAAVLDPSGALLTDLGNLTYTISNGVITFSATGGHSLTEFTTAQLISAAEILVNSSSTGGANKVVVFSSGGNSYVVASDAGATLATGLDAKDTLVQLTGVASSTGFGATGAQGAVVSNSLTYVDSGKANTGSVTAAVYDQTGFSVDQITSAEFGTVSTTITNLAPSARLALGNGAAATLEGITIAQTGTAGQNSLTLELDGGQTFKSVTVTGDGLLVLNPLANATITSLVDGGATNTLATIKVGAGAFTTTVTGITDTALTAIDSTAATGAVTFGSATTAIANNGVTFSLSAAQNSTFFSSGASDTFTQLSGVGVVNLTASGSSNTISALSTSAANNITANGAGDTISVGTGNFAITATGSGDTINIASGVVAGSGTGVSSVIVGSAATVNIGTLNTANAGADTINVTAAVTGGTTASYASTTINFVSGSTIVGNKISFDTNLGDVFTLLGASAAASQVNVATATSLADALNMAANFTLLTQVQGAAASTATLAANTGRIDWFQYGGDTYVVAMVNSTGAAVQQTALDANDIVVKITGMVDLTASALAAEVFTI